MGKLKKIVLVAILLSNLSLNAQTDQPLHLPVDLLTIDEGMPSNEVRLIFEDSIGFMWFVTDSGLVKYDSHDMTIFRTNPDDPNTISSEEFVCGLPDEKGRVWIGTNRGLNRIDSLTGTIQRYFHDPAKPGSISHDWIMSLSKDKKGRLWVGTEDGLNLWDPETDSFRVYRHDPANPHSLPGNTVRLIQEDPGGGLWLALSGYGIGRWDPETNRFESIKINPSDLEEYQQSIGSENKNDIRPGIGTDVVCLFVDRRGKVWWGTWGDGLFYYDPQSETCRNFQAKEDNPNGLVGNIIANIKEDPQGRIWIATYNQGACILDPETFSFQTIQITNKMKPNTKIRMTWNFYWDPQGNLWVGTMDHGVCLHDRSQQPIQYWINNPEDPNSLSNNRVFALSAAPDNTVWIGTDGGGLNHFDPQSGTFTHYSYDPDDPKTLSSNTIVSLLHDRKGTLWIGGWVTSRAVLSRFDPSTQTFQHYYWLDQKKSVITRTLWEDSQGWIWVGLETESLFVFNPETEEIRKFSIGEKGYNTARICRIMEDHTGRIWIATNRGLQYYSRQDDRFEDFITEEADLVLPSCIYHTLFEDSRQTLWLGTGEGLYALSPDRKSVKRYTTQDGLPNNVVKSILEDEQGRLWISFDVGISCFDPHTGTIRNFDKIDGLRGFEFTANCCTKDNNGALYFGGTNGLNQIWPKWDNRNTHVPPVVLKSMELMGQAIPLSSIPSITKPLVLNYKQNFINFEFSVLNFTQPHKNQYAYRLFPLETTWNQTKTSRYGRYTFLQPGYYQLQLKGSNNDGVWNEEGLSIPILITPPFWSTWWFRLILVTFGAGILLFYYWRIQKWNKILETKVREQTHKLYEMNQTLENLSMQDGLTCIANRRCFDDLFQKEWARAMRNQVPLSFLFCDVDFFKKYNDHYGHMAGDECLKNIANLLRNNVKRVGDLVARYGGEEFVIVLVDTNALQAQSFAEKLCQQVENMAWPHAMSEINRVVTISIGVASMIPDSQLGCDQLIQAADQGLYIAKSQGRNRAEICAVS